MFVSSPVSQICLVLSTKFKEEDDRETCITLISEISTNDSETNSESFNKKLLSFLKELSNSNNLVFYTSSFVAYYFEKRNHSEMYDLFTKLMSEYMEHQEKISDYNAGYLAGVFSTALMSDLGLNETENIPKDIQEAIKYIESGDYVVHIERTIK